MPDPLRRAPAPVELDLFLERLAGLRDLGISLEQMGRLHALEDAPEALAREALARRFDELRGPRVDFANLEVDDLTLGIAHVAQQPERVEAAFGGGAKQRLCL